MLMDLLKALEKWRLPAIFAAGGIGFLYFSFFTGLPAPANAWSPNLRISANHTLFVLGIMLVAVGFGLGYSSEVEGQPALARKAFLLIFPSRTIKSRYERLSDTQKEIVIFLYQHSHKPRIALSELFKSFVGLHGPDLVRSEDELFYRLKDLHSDGFLGKATIAPRETDIIKVDSVEKALRNADILKS